MMARGPISSLRQDLITVTEHKEGWFMARNVKKEVAELRGKPIHSVSLGRELSAMAQDRLLEERKITKRGNDNGTREYRVRWLAMPNKEAAHNHYYAGIEKHLKNLSEFKLKGDKE